MAVKQVPLDQIQDNPYQTCTDRSLQHHMYGSVTSTPKLIGDIVTVLMSSKVLRWSK
jgi:hypothetical protein